MENSINFFASKDNGKEHIMHSKTNGIEGDEAVKTI